MCIKKIFVCGCSWDGRPSTECSAAAYVGEWSGQVRDGEFELERVFDVVWGRRLSAGQQRQRRLRDDARTTAVCRTALWRRRQRSRTSLTHGFHCNAPHRVLREKKSVTQQLAAASGVRRAVGVPQASLRESPRFRIIIINITKTMFMVLSSWQSHCESSPGSFDERRMAPSGRWPKTKPDDLGCESACTGCQKLHPPSPFIIITEPGSWYSFYRPTEGRRLSRPSWLVTYQDGLPVHRQSPILVLTGSDVAQLRWSRPTRYH